jgi:hypothetical protein
MTINNVYIYYIAKKLQVHKKINACLGGFTLEEKNNDADFCF